MKKEVWWGSVEESEVAAMKNGAHLNYLLPGEATGKKGEKQWSNL